jgi:hypothetical protein
VSLKPAIVPSSTNLCCYLKVRMKEAFRSVFSRDESGLWESWRRLPLGSVCKATITAFKDYGIVFTADDKITTMIALNERSTGTKVGKVVSVVILDADLTKRVLEVSTDKSLIEELSSNVSVAKIFKTETIYQGKILLIKEKYLVVLVDSTIGFVMVSDYHSPYLGTGEFAVGKLLQLQLLCPKIERQDVSCATFPHEDSPVWIVYNESKIPRKELLR